MNTYTKHFYLYICASCFILGIIWFCWMNSIIIFHWPTKKYSLPKQTTAIEKKQVKLFFMGHEKWHYETVELIWSTHDMQENIRLLINAWLKLMYDELLIKKQVNIETVMIVQQELFISCDRNILDKTQSAYQKLLCIESLLHTIRNNYSNISYVHILVSHKPLLDYHLDFSCPWPVEGFLSHC